MARGRGRTAAFCGVALCVLFATASARQERLPSARLVAAPRVVMPGAVDSNMPMAWSLADGWPSLVAFTSFAGIPSRLTGPSFDLMQEAGPVTIDPHPGHGIWIEAVVVDDGGTWYGYYHHETPADACGRSDRFVPRIGALKSADRGATWEPLGVILEAPPDSVACRSTNRYVLGGVGDLSVLLTPDRSDLFLFFSQYPITPSEQGVAVARMAWADRDAPAGRLTVWHDGAWLPPRPAAGAGEPGVVYAAGTPLVAVSKPWHDGSVAADAFWGPSVHWNGYLERYVMLLNRTRDESFNNEGIYVAYADTLSDPRAWSAPRKILNGGGRYPQVVGLEPAAGTDKDAGQTARFFLTGRSEHVIQFGRP